MGSQKHQGRYQGQRPAWLLPSLLLLLLNGFLHGVVATAPGQSPGGLQSSHNEDSLTMASSHVAAPPSKAEANPVAESSAEDRAKPQQTVKRTAQQGTAVNPIILHLALQEGKESVSQPQAAATWAEPAGLQEERLQEEIGDGLYYRGLRALLGRQEKVPPAKQPQQQPCPSPDLPLGGDLLAQAAAMGHPDAQSTVALLHSEGLLTAASRRPMLLGERDEAAASAFHHFAMLGGSQASKVALAYAAFQGGSTMCDRGALLYAQAAQSAVASINDYHKHDGNRLVESVRLSAGPLGGARFYDVNPEALMGNGFGGEEDDTIQFTKLAAEQGHALSLRTMGNLHFWGARGVQRNAARALDYFRRAAAAGQASAHANIGEMYARGLGVPQDPEAALKHFKAAVDSGNTAALNGMGYIHSQNLSNKPRNLTAAALFFKRAAEHGQPDGLYNWGVMTMSGHGVKKDMTEARRVFALASRSGHVLATFNLGKLEMRGWGGEKDTCSAMAHFKAQGLPPFPPRSPTPCPAHLPQLLAQRFLCTVPSYQ
mmetsp:Transcript_16658/g.46558  ORF Transcript_16658/g.46558 Transcript_16658/m.46558 type:complete len:542 (+) Transcript_16658:465-2090(+)